MPNDQKRITVELLIPTDEEAQGWLADLIQKSGQPAENQLSIRAWITRLTTDAAKWREQEQAKLDAEQGQEAA